MAKGKPTLVRRKEKLPPGIFRDANGLFLRVSLGSGEDRLSEYYRLQREDYSFIEMEALVADAKKKLEKERGEVAKRFTLAADVQRYLRDGDISPATRKRRTQQLPFWCEQPVGLDAPVFTPDQVAARIEARQRGEEVSSHGPTLGETPRHKLEPQRLRKILAVAFAPTDPEADPYEFASTSNHYRGALLHLCNELDQDDPNAPRPFHGIKVRAQRFAEEKWMDPRIVAEVIKQFPSERGRKGLGLSLQRVAVLAWVHITPQQLKQIDPAKDFHDVPDATRDDIINGAITLTKQPRRKGRKNRPLPPPETIPLNPWGVEAVRALVANPDAWRSKMSLSPLNKMFKRACARAQVVLSQRGILVDLSSFTLYDLKHCLATTATIAAPGLIDVKGDVMQNKGVSRALDHSSTSTTKIYTQAAVNPLIREVNRLTSLYLEQVFKEPLKGPTKLRLVATGDGRA